jgi:predicted membrane-bound spermidine synthase
MHRQHALSMSVGLFLITLTMLMVEVLLIRVFDVILLPNMGYLVITLAIFASGLSGVYATIRPLPRGAGIQKKLAVLSLVLAASIFLLRPAFNEIALMYPGTRGSFSAGPMKYLIGFGLIYLLLVVPFFLSGLVLTCLFSAYPSKIRSLYFWDLFGAALGCVIFVPFLRMLGPGGLMFWAAAITVLASALFAGRRDLLLISLLIAFGLFVIPVVKTDGYFDFSMHVSKRGVRTAYLAGQVEVTEWDPISKIDVINQDRVDPETHQRIPVSKHVAYDGGAQSSTFFSFDGDYKHLRQTVLDGSEPVGRHFWQRGVLVSHYLKRDTGAEVLIFGSAGGQETKAALLFNPTRVDGVELVATVVRLGKETYADYIGRIFNDPRVNNRAGEGRSYLRMTSQKYDIIQLYSNHTSSNVAAGTGATAPIYLQTVEAYQEYFSHLKDDGILHINHHFYPRMITTAAQAWKQTGRIDFQRHVLVYERPGGDTLATLLVKLSPWTEQEVAQVKTFFAVPDGEPNPPHMVVDPMDPGKGFLSAEFFSGEFPSELQRGMDYWVQPSTDDWPYFNNIQRGFNQVEEDPERFLNESMTQSINGRLQMPVGEYTNFTALGLVGLVFSIVMVFVPLAFSGAGRDHWPAKYISIAYFACLGAGFIIIELVLIQISMKLIGFPLYTFSAVIFSMLLAAGLGSMAADRFRMNPNSRWAIPFIGILISGMTLWGIYPHIINVFLAVPTLGRIATAMAMIFPLAFFLGMPFPLGMLALEKQPTGAIAWAWGINALFTAIGGLAAGVLSIFLGFRLTLLVAFVLYFFAFLLFSRLRLAAGAYTRTLVERDSLKHSVGHLITKF